MNRVTDFESRILQWLENIVMEANASLDDNPVVYDSRRAGNFAERARELDKAALQLWARIFDKCNSAWPFVRLAGASLKKFAERMSE